MGALLQMVHFLQTLGYNTIPDNASCTDVLYKWIKPVKAGSEAQLKDIHIQRHKGVITVYVVI